MSSDPFVIRWSDRAEAMARLGALVSGAALIAEILADYESANAGRSDEILTLAQAAEESGYSTDHLRLLIRQAKIPNAGRRQAPRLRRRDIPRKPGQGATLGAGRYLSFTSAERVARSLITGD